MSKSETREWKLDPGKRLREDLKQIHCLDQEQKRLKTEIADKSGADTSDLQEELDLCKQISGWYEDDAANEIMKKRSSGK